jgi:2',3'-cyclic-nucleotide 2'-phosphodiesterase (5'-nucleotidase family)
LTFPIICANIKTDTKKLSDNLVPFHILEKWDIDVVSVITPDTKRAYLPSFSYDLC